MTSSMSFLMREWPALRYTYAKPTHQGCETRGRGFHEANFPRVLGQLLANGLCAPNKLANAAAITRVSPRSRSKCRRFRSQHRLHP